MSGLFRQDRLDNETLISRNVPVVSWPAPLLPADLLLLRAVVYGGRR